jgi:hypothetical protein
VKDKGLTTKEAFAAMADGYVVRSCEEYEYCIDADGNLCMRKGGCIDWKGADLFENEARSPWSIVKEEVWVEKWTSAFANYHVLRSDQETAEGVCAKYGGKATRIKVLETTYKRAPEGV